MINKILASIILLSFITFCISLVGNVYPNEMLGVIERLATTIFLACGIFFLSKNGTYIYQSTFYWSVGSIFLLICGVLFRTMHWQYAFLLIACGCFTLLAFYTYHFIRKPIKAELDWIKLLFAYAYVVSRYTNSFIYDIYNYFPHYLAVGLLAVALFLFFYKPTIKNPHQVLDDSDHFVP